MDYLVFQLQAPLSSWGEPAVGEFRGTAEHPGQSALIGLLGAALGLLRENDAGHTALRDAYGFAVGVLSKGSLLRDYHTAQVPSRVALKGHPHSTRRDELAVQKSDLGTILSTRDYRQNAASLVAVQPRNGAALPHTLESLATALREPQFTLYLGRKTCVLGAPLWPQVLQADSAHAAFMGYISRFESARQAAIPKKQKSKEPEWVQSKALLDPLPALMYLAFDEHIHAGIPYDLSTRRKDWLISRNNWQFCDRNEYLAFIPEAPRTDSLDLIDHKV